MEKIVNKIEHFAEKHNLDITKNKRDGSNFQFILSNKSYQIEILSDRGESFIYIEFVNMKTRQKIYSLNLLSQLLKDKLRKDLVVMIDYLDSNLDRIVELFLDQNLHATEDGYNELLQISRKLP